MGDAQRVILVIADIGGYTRFMVTNKLEILHSQVIISELIKTIIEQVEIPLEISKLEGDAVFLYSVKDDSEAKWSNTRKTIGGKLIKFFDAFSNKISELSGTNLCACKACKNVTQLRLKVIAHSGEALFYSIGKFRELAGVDVIVAHRLLKNSVRADQYILMTEQAYKDIQFPENIRVSEGEEEYDELGSIKTFTYLISAAAETDSDAKYKQKQFSIFSKVIHAVLKEYETALFASGLKTPPRLNHLNFVSERKSNEA